MSLSYINRYHKSNFIEEVNYQMIIQNANLKEFKLEVQLNNVKIMHPFEFSYSV
jgi:hypothetical protein